MDWVWGALGWVGFVVGLVVIWGVTLYGWVFASASHGFPKQFVMVVPSLLGLSAVVGLGLLLTGNPGWAALTMLLVAPALSFAFSFVMLW